VLADCDRLTISPALLKELEQSTDLIPSELSTENA
jgi:transaldolase